IGADEYNATPPTINVPAEITTTATSSKGAVVTYAAEATSADDVIRSSDCTPASGSTFPIGKTTVTCTATDGHETTATASFVVTVTEKVEKITPTFTNWPVTGSLTAGGPTNPPPPPQRGKVNSTARTAKTHDSPPPEPAQAQGRGARADPDRGALAPRDIGGTHASPTAATPPRRRNREGGSHLTCQPQQPRSAQAGTFTKT